MIQATYRHYLGFTRRYVRSVMMMGLTKKPRIEAEIFAEMVHNEQVVHSNNGELLMLEWHHSREAINHTGGRRVASRRWPTSRA